MSRKSRKEEREQKAASEEQETTATAEESGEAQDENQTEQKGEDDFEAKFNEMNDRYLRIYSEFENFRKRTAKERLDLLKNASGDIMKDMLSVLDDFERAIKANEDTQDPEALKEGFKLIHTKLYKTLESKGLKPMDAEGKEFDVDVHEAITRFPVEDESKKGKVIDVVEKGYYLNDTVLRYAKVVVGQ